MISHTFFKIIETEYDDCFVAKYTIEKVTYCTNDSGCGLFSETCLTQITGNRQFSGGREAVRRYFDNPESTGERVIDTERGARRVRDKLRKENPLRRIPIHRYSPGDCVYHNGYRCTVTSQDKRNVKIKYASDLDGYSICVKDYSLT